MVSRKKAKINNQSSPTQGKKKTEKPKNMTYDKAPYINKMGKKSFGVIGVIKGVSNTLNNIRFK